MVTAMPATNRSINAALGTTEPVAYTLQEVADLLSLSYRKVRYMVEAGELKVVHFGRARRVTAKALREYVDEREQAARAS